MNYRVWIGVSVVKGQPFTHIALKKGEYKDYQNDEEAKRLVRAKAKGYINSIGWFTSVSYATLKPDGTYMTGIFK